MSEILWPNGVQEDRVLLMVSDAAAYMIKAGKALQVFFSNMVHLTCLAHGLHRVAETVRSIFHDVDLLISSTKKVFVKAPSRVMQYKEIHPELPLPPVPVLTRWGSWLHAADFYATHFNEVKEVCTNIIYIV